MVSTPHRDEYHFITAIKGDTCIVDNLHIDRRTLEQEYKLCELKPAYRDDYQQWVSNVMTPSVTEYVRLSSYPTKWDKLSIEQVLESLHCGLFVSGSWYAIPAVGDAEFNTEMVLSNVRGPQLFDEGGGGAVCTSTGLNGRYIVRGVACIEDTPTPPSFQSQQCVSDAMFVLLPFLPPLALAKLGVLSKSFHAAFQGWQPHYTLQGPLRVE
jgi:hypothetical protein